MGYERPRDLPPLERTAWCAYTYTQLILDTISSPILRHVLQLKCSNPQPGGPLIFQNVTQNRATNSYLDNFSIILRSSSTGGVKQPAFVDVAVQPP